MDTESNEKEQGLRKPEFGSNARISIAGIKNKEQKPLEVNPGHKKMDDLDQILNHEVPWAPSRGSVVFTPRESIKGRSKHWKSRRQFCALAEPCPGSWIRSKGSPTRLSPLSRIPKASSFPHPSEGFKLEVIRSCFSLIEFVIGIFVRICHSSL